MDKILISLIFCWIIHIQAFKVSQPDRVESEIISYMEKYKTCNIPPSVTCFFTHDNSLAAKDVVGKVIFAQENCGVLLKSSRVGIKDWAKGDTFEASDIFVIFENIDDIIDDGKHMVNYTFWSSETRVHFLFCKQIEARDQIDRLLHNIWHQKIYNFVFVAIEIEYKVYTFNNFSKNKSIALDSSTKDFCKAFTPDKIRNLEGSIVRVALFEKLPNIKWNEAAKRFEGSDVDIMNVFGSITKATLQIFKKSDGFAAIDSLHSNETDIAFVGILQVKFP